MKLRYGLAPSYDYPKNEDFKPMTSLNDELDRILVEAMEAIATGVLTDRWTPRHTRQQILDLIASKIKEADKKSYTRGYADGCLDSELKKGA